MGNKTSSSKAPKAKAKGSTKSKVVAGVKGAGKRAAAAASRKGGGKKK